MPGMVRTLFDDARSVRVMGFLGSMQSLVPALAPNMRSNCMRCGTVLRLTRADPMNHHLALTFAGLVLGYVWYDLTHYYLHHALPTTAMGKWLRKYHLVHHFKTPGVRYGITTPLWDLVFGTYPKDSYQEKADEIVAEA